MSSRSCRDSRPLPLKDVKEKKGLKMAVAPQRSASLDEAVRAAARTVSMTEADFGRLSSFIEEELGIKMPPSKKALLESRLQKRLRFHGIRSFREYSDYVFSPGGSAEELIHMIDLVTTNKTDFFREPYHFDYLYRNALPELAPGALAARRPVTVWSAGCSTGEEPYTIAMVLSEYAEGSAGFDFQIHATDVSTRVLDMASRGVYVEERVNPVPVELRRKYFLRSTDRSSALVKVSRTLRSKVSFSRLNFMDPEFLLRDLDVIFCRNVIIYFDRPTQKRLFDKFCGCLRAGGFLFIGHSETLNGFNLPFSKAGPAVYRKTR